MSSEESAAPPPAALRTWELWLAFIFGLGMLVVPDIFGFFQSAARGTPISVVEIVGTSLDATFFLIVVYLLRRDLLRRRVAAAALKRSNAEIDRAGEASIKLQALTAREREVLDGLARGLPNKTIAYDLGISPRTVEIHRANLMSKLGVKSFSEALRIAFAAEEKSRA